MLLHRARSTRFAAPAALVLLALVTPAAASAGTWPMFHHDNNHSGVSSETAVNTTTAASLGVNWQVNTGSQARTSPIIAHSTALNQDLVYEGSDNGVISAYDAHTGDRVWWHKVGATVNSTPAV